MISAIVCTDPTNIKTSLPQALEDLTIKDETIICKQAGAELGLSWAKLSSKLASKAS